MKYLPLLMLLLITSANAKIIRIPDGYEAFAGMCENNTCVINDKESMDITIGDTVFTVSMKSDKPVTLPIQLHFAGQYGVETIHLANTNDEGYQVIGGTGGNVSECFDYAGHIAKHGASSSSVQKLEASIHKPLVTSIIKSDAEMLK